MGVQALHIVEPLAPKHDRAAFSCGNESLDRYLRQQVGQEVKRKLAVAYVACVKGSNEVVGYYTLSSFAVFPRELPDALRRKLPQYDRLPAILLGRLAVDLRMKGQKLGGLLLLDALLRCLEQSEQLGALAVVVDAIDENAVGFYTHHGFQPLVDHPDRLYIPTATIAKLRN